MLKLLFTCVFFNVVVGVKSQVVYEVDFDPNATKTFVTKYRQSATWFIYRTNFRAEAGNGVWFFSNTMQDSELLIEFVDSELDADLVIYYVDNAREAGKQNDDGF